MGGLAIVTSYVTLFSDLIINSHHDFDFSLWGTINFTFCSPNAFLNGTCRYIYFEIVTFIDFKEQLIKKTNGLYVENSLIIILFSTRMYPLLSGAPSNQKVTIYVSSTDELEFPFGWTETY